METIIEPIHLLSGLLRETALLDLTAGALQHRKFSLVMFKNTPYWS